MRLKVNLLGPFDAEAEGIPVRIVGRKGIALLAYLVRRGGSVPRESLTTLLWPDSDHSHARASLRQILVTVRRDLGAAAGAVIATADHAIAADNRNVDADFATFGRLARSDYVTDLEAAHLLWRGSFLEGLGPVTPEFDSWADAERSALRADYETLLLRLCDLHAAAGRTEEMLTTALRLLVLDPLQEHVHRRVIDGYRRQRRYDAAIRQFETLRTLLKGELGVSPEPVTLDLIREVRRARGAVGSGPPRFEPSQAPADPASPSTRPSIAVLPFAGLSGGPDAALLGEGIAEEVIVNLSRDRELLVVSRQSSFHPQVVQAAPDEIGARLGARFLLFGSVRSVAGRMRVMAHLARSDDASEIWSETYDREIGDIFAVQSEIARMVMATAIGRIADEEARRVISAGADELDAWRLVLLGLRQLHSYTPDGMRAAIDHLSRAVALAPDNGRAHGLLALARIYERWNYVGRTEVADILPLAERALVLDSRDSRAHCAMAVASLLSRDHDRAGHHYEVGLAANPNDDLLQIEYGRYLFYIDRPEEGLRRINEAMRLNPLHPDWFWNIQGRCLHLLGRHAEALAAFRHIAAPAFFHFAYMASCHHALGQDDAAEAMRDRLSESKPDFEVAGFVATLPHRNPATAQRFAREFDWLH
jgi:DNA-binding SARP family transcriptional activator/TolB-like protein/Flp pilus assembly protein TadD